MAVGGIAGAAWAVVLWVRAAPDGFAPTSNIHRAADATGLYWPLMTGGVPVLAVLAYDIVLRCRACWETEEYLEMLRRFAREHGIDRDAEAARRTKNR